MVALNCWNKKVRPKLYRNESIRQKKSEIIYHIRSLQAKVKYSILLLQQIEKKYLIVKTCRGESCGYLTILIPEARYSEGSAQD